MNIKQEIAMLEAAMLEADRPTVGGWHLVHILFTLGTVGGWILFWILHAVVVSSMNTTIDKKIRVLKMYSYDDNDSSINKGTK
tara:strand:+ start:3428 stop:3676 length:249 start_codon:yes stop_codon:yes gene_type:complete